MSFILFVYPLPLPWLSPDYIPPEMLGQPNGQEAPTLPHKTLRPFAFCTTLLALNPLTLPACISQQAFMDHSLCDLAPGSALLNTDMWGTLCLPETF